MDWTPLMQRKVAMGSIWATDVRARFIGAVALAFVLAWVAHTSGLTSQRQIPRSASSMMDEAETKRSGVSGFYARQV